MAQITIRGSANAKRGLIEMIEYINQTADVSQLTILEIGSYVGDSAEIFAQRFGKVICVDPWQNGYDPKDAASYQHPMSAIEEQFNRMAKQYPNIEKRKMTSEENFLKYPFELYDVVYIDGIHTYAGAKSDIKNYADRARLFLCGHDFQLRFQGVIDAVREMVGEPHKVFSDTSWSFKR